MKRYPVVLSTLAAALLCLGAEAAPTRAYVQSTGDDANVGAGCPSDFPCRTFAAAVGIAPDGGEVVALDTEDFGTVELTKSITLVGNGRAAIMGNFASDAAVRLTKSGIKVVLRGLDINGSTGGMTGVYVKDGASLQVENCVIANFVTHGIDVSVPASVRVVDSVLSGNSNGAYVHGGATAHFERVRFIGNRGTGLGVTADVGTTTVSVSNSVASNNGVSGFDVSSSTAGATARMLVTGSSASHNQYGFTTSASAGSATITVDRSAASHNQYGFARIPSAPPGGVSTFESLGNNAVRQNGAASLGAITVVSPM
ncbi:hypothetical protein BWI17_11225 [Betaproteobacteria bacterium GR16-43]|nr:hypothetical protein BWI17_11225 [Betaproteobacteria bacterium GR16-43]